MADVTIKYKGETIAEMSGMSEKTLETGGTYCEGDIDVVYAPRTKSYEITLAKAYGRTLLTTLDEDVLAHINDASLIVTLNNMSAYDNQTYTGYNFIVRNMSYGTCNSTPIYGMADRIQSSGYSAPFNIYSPANYTETSDKSGAYATFHYIGGKYYITPGDGYIASGTYRLTFTW